MFSGTIHPATGPTNKSTGYKVNRFGPVTAWTLDCFGESVQVSIPKRSIHGPQRFSPGQMLWIWVAGLGLMHVSPSIGQSATKLSGHVLQVVLATDKAQYVCVRPAAGYKKLYSHLAEQAEITFQVPATLIISQTCIIVLHCNNVYNPQGPETSA